MAIATEKFNTYKGDFRSTMRHTINMISGKDVPNYTLVFLDATSKHPAGGHETMFSPNIVMGRGDNCQIKYDDSYKTVSKEHACITVSDKRFYVFHNPDAKNPTYVNGNVVEDSHVLQNGDEIKLSIDGPRIRFNLSTMKASTMGLTSRVALALGQATRPYKRAIVAISIALLSALGFGGYSLYQNIGLKNKAAEEQKHLERIYGEKERLNEEIKRLEDVGLDNSKEMTALKKKLAKNQQQLEEAQKNADAPVIIYEVIDEPVPVVVPNNTKQPQDPDAMYKEDAGSEEKSSRPHNEKINFESMPVSDVYYIAASKAEVKLNGKRTVMSSKDSGKNALWSGTAFLTESGQLITARHIIQPWRFRNLEEKWLRELSADETKGGIIEVTFEVRTPEGNTFTFNQTNVKIDDSSDDIIAISPEEKLSKLERKRKEKERPKRVIKRSSDWAYTSFTNRKGTITLDKEKAVSLKAGTKLYAYGYTSGKASTKSTDLSPDFIEMTVSKSGLTEGMINISKREFNPGTIGSPVFIEENGKFKVIGILSDNGMVVPVSGIN